MFHVYSSKGQLSEAASTLATALQARELRRDRELKQNGGIGAATQDAITNLDGLAKALGRRSPKDGEGELEGALLAVDHINRLAWRYFVQNLPFEGHSVMGEVGRRGLLYPAQGIRLVCLRSFGFRFGLLVATQDG